jgi:hypothetical protein
MPNVAAGAGEQRAKRPVKGRVDQLFMANSGTNAEMPVPSLDLTKTCDLAYIDKYLGSCEAKVHHRHEALPAGEHFCFVAVLGEQRQGLVNGAWPLILKYRRLHSCLPLYDTV